MNMFDDSAERDIRTAIKLLDKLNSGNGGLCKVCWKFMDKGHAPDCEYNRLKLKWEREKV